MRRSRLLPLLAWLLLTALGPARADRTYLQPGRVFSGDIVELVIEYDNPIPSLYALDTGALEPDFEVLQVDSKVTRVNDGARAFHRMQSVVKLLPRRSGELIVPALSFGDRSSPELKLEVVPLTPEMHLRDQVIVELDAQPLDPYVGQQVLLKLRLLNNVPIAEGTLVEPRAEAARSFRHNDLRNYQVERDGQGFEVREQTISLIPTRAGTLRLTPASYRGRVISSRLNAPEQNAAGARVIERRGTAPNLEVREPPPAYSGAYWLPASRVELTRKLGEAIGQAMAGDVLDLELGISAVGLAAEFLPADLYAFDGDEVKIYADQAQRGNRFDGGNLVGHLRQRYAVVVARPGRIELPEVVLTWWDVGADRERQARLEARIIEVGGGAETAPRSSDAGFGERAARLSANAWPWLATLLAAGLAALLLAGPRRRLGARVRGLRARRYIRSGLKRACRENDAAAARGYLLQWGRARWPRASVNGLFQLAILAGDASLQAQLKRLDARLFAAHEPGWRGELLWRAIENFEAGGDRAAAPDSLPRLYPSSAEVLSSSSVQPAAGSKRSPYFAA